MKKKIFEKDALTILRGKIKTYKIASFDIETETEDDFNTFLVGGFLDANGKYKSFTDRDKMIAYMEKHIDKNTMVYATNNHFDYIALFGHRRDFFKNKPLLRGSLLIRAKYNNIETFDTRAYTQASVEQLGDMLGIPKLKFNVNKKNKKILTNWNKRKLVAYNKQDCIITREFIIKFQEVLNHLGGNLKSTISSCAMDLFRRKYLVKEIHHEYVKEFKDGTKIKDLQLLAYHGGRTEMFKRGYDKDGIYYLGDFNSLYPSVMLNEYPNPASAILTEHEDGKLNKSSILKYDGISDCEVFCPNMYYPLLSMYENKKLCFPIGRFRQVFTHVELRKALSIGYKILRVYKTITYTKNIRPFSKWVNDIYGLRMSYAKDGNKIYSDMIKIILNSLYGKFFQRNVSDFEFLNLEDRKDSDEQLGFTFDYQQGYGYRETPKESNQKFITPIFAVYTTAYARLKLYDALVKYKALFCDTDSVMTKTKIVSSKELGDLKVEYSCNQLNIAKQKHYSAYNLDKNKYIYKVKGVKLGDKDRKDFDESRKEDFEKSISGKPIKQMKFLSIKESIVRKMKPNQRIFMTKKIDLHDTKRLWDKEYSINGMQDSRPIICNYKDVDSLMKEYESVKELF